MGPLLRSDVLKKVQVQTGIEVTLTTVVHLPAQGSVAGLKPNA